MLEAKFDKSGAIWFTPKKGKPFDARRLQSGMFMDRPDLWTRPKRNHRKRAPEAQLNLFGERDGL